ncbi:MAG TPA: sialidase family protein [Terriglobales bacterium]|nr:sialidase family protein [Terriglobales bacterium]
MFRRPRVLLVLSAFSLAANLALAQAPTPGFVKKQRYNLDVRSSAKVIAENIRSANAQGTADAAAADGLQSSAGFFAPPVPPIWIGALTLEGGNVLVNDPNSDSIQIFPGTRPFVHTTESETAIAKSGSGLAAGYNSSAGALVGPNPAGPGLVFVQLLFSAFSFSSSDGASWISGFLPPVPGSAFTLGDPAMAVGPNGTIYYAGLGMDAKGNLVVQLNRSNNGGMTWSDGIVVAKDEGADKEWIATGPDGTIYVTWSSFQNDGSIQLRLAKSTDGGDTWTQKIVFAPLANPNPKLPQNQLSFTQPAVDSSTGKLYIPFVHFSGSDQDFIRILISNDKGATFHFAAFNIPGAPLKTVLPITQAGDLEECGAFLPSSEPIVLGGAAPKPKFIPNVRLALHTGRNVGGSFTGLPRWVNSARMNPQPAFAVHNGVLYLAWTDSRAKVVADLNAGSDVFFIRSNNGGKTWTSRRRVNPASPFDLYHVEPSIATSEGGKDVHIAYYTQHKSGRKDVDLATSTNRGDSFPFSKWRRVTSISSAIPPTNVPLPTPDNPFNTTNYDRVVAQCYDVGEYLAIERTGGTVRTVWGDDRRLIRQPVSEFDPLSGRIHAQQDVFYQQFQEK